MKRFLIAALVLGCIPALAQTPKPVSQSAVLETTATITAIDKGARMITLEDEDGESETIFAGPEVKRFDELKVGQKVTFRYYESMVTQVRKPGEAGATPPSGVPKLSRGTGATPSATVAQQLMATVTVKAIDPKVPSMTVETEDGNTLSFKVDDKKNIQNVKVGDRVEITYTAAVMITVK
jgi:Cu/Ag efflux protein CusF